MRALLILTALCTLHLAAQNKQMENQGLINIKTVDPSIKVALMYARADNFCGKTLYTDLRQAYMLPQCAQALKKAQAELRRRRPDLSLCIFDATRPMSIQQIMWNTVKNTPQQNYVSNPARGGGMHNYGMALDISICKATWNENQWQPGNKPCKIDTLHMGTKVDHMGPASHIDNEPRHISPQAIANRQLLRQVMQAAGFTPLRTEWWHFNLCTRAWAKANLRVIK